MTPLEKQVFNPVVSLSCNSSHFESPVSPKDSIVISSFTSPVTSVCPRYSATYVRYAKDCNKQHRSFQPRENKADNPWLSLMEGNWVIIVRRFVLREISTTVVSDGSAETSNETFWHNTLFFSDVTHEDPRKWESNYDELLQNYKTVQVDAAQQMDSFAE